MNAPELLEHGSEAWASARCGNACASELSSILAKGKEGRMRRAYLRRLVSERLTGKAAETFSNSQTKRGTEQEPYAIAAYEAETGHFVQHGVFLRHPQVAAVGTPDGLVNDDGGVEFKSVIPTVQVDTLLRDDMPPEHRPQVQGYLWLSGRSWWDYASFCADMPEHLQLCVYRVTPDLDYIAMLEKEVRTFLAEVDQLYARLNDRRSLTELLVASLRDAA